MKVNPKSLPPREVVEKRIFDVAEAIVTSFPQVVDPTIVLAALGCISASLLVAGYPLDKTEYVRDQFYDTINKHIVQMKKDQMN